MERILAEESGNRIVYVVLHHEDEDSKYKDKEQRDLAEVSDDLLIKFITVAVPLCPITEVALSERRKLVAEHRDGQKDMELECVRLLEERDDLLFVVRENKTRKECRCSVDPPFTVEPEDLLVHPPFETVLEERFVRPPLVRPCPVCEVADAHAACTHREDKYEYDREAYGTVLDKAECQEEYEVQDSKDYREPCVSVHHRKARKVCEPLHLVERILDYEHQESVYQNVYIERNDDRLNDPLSDKTLEIIFLRIETLDKTKARAEEKDSYKVSAGIYEGRKDSFFLEERLLRDVMDNDSDSGKTPE